MSCHEFVLSLRVEFRCASDLEDEKCSVSKAPEIVVTRKTHWECVESSEGFLCQFQHEVVKLVFLARVDLPPD